MSLFRFHRKRDIKLLNPKNDLTLWDDYTHHKAVALENSLQFSSEDISFLTAGPGKPLNIPSQIPQRQSFQTGQCSVSFNSLKRMHTSERSFLECFFPGFNSGYFTFCQSVLFAAKYPFFSFTGTVFKKCLMRKEVKFPEWNAHITKQFLRKLLSRFMWRYLLFPHSPECAPQCPFAFPSITQFQNCVIEKSFIYGRWIDISATAQFHRNLLSSFCLRIFPFSP